MDKSFRKIAMILSAFLIIIVALGLSLRLTEKQESSITNKNSTKNQTVEIEDTCEEDSVFPDAIEEYYRNEEYTCTFNQVKSSCYTVKVDGKEYSLKDALNDKVITVEEAINEGMNCQKINVSDKDEDSTIPSNTNVESNSNSNTVSNANSNTNIIENTNTNTNTNTNVNANSNINANVSSNKVSNSNVISNSNVSSQNKISIIDRCGDATTQQIDEFYQDNAYIYYFTSGRSSCIYVNVNGKEYSLRNALNSNVVTISELEAVGFSCLKKSRNLVDK